MRSENQDTPAIKEIDDRKYWAMAPGEQAVLWKECLKNGVIYLGWNKPYPKDLSKSPTAAGLLVSHTPST